LWICKKPWADDLVGKAATIREAALKRQVGEATSPELTPVGERGHRQCPVCNSLLAGNLAGNFLEKSPEERFLRPKRGQHQMVTGKLPAQRSSEFLLTEQGSLSREQGMLRRGSGGSRGQRSSFPRCYARDDLWRAIRAVIVSEAPVRRLIEQTARLQEQLVHKRVLLRHLTEGNLKRAI
jgi:hypothetical protein